MKTELGMTQGERRFVIVWSLVLALVLMGLGTGSIIMVNQYREAATVRHTARIDAQAVEPGRTAAETALPAGANPRRVTVGMYLDNIAAISILESSWSPVFYIWFRWTGDDLAPGETFQIVEGEITEKTKLSERVVNGEHYAVYLVRAQVTKFFTADRFPVDDHLLTLAIEDGERPWMELEYVPDVQNSDISSRVKMPGYVVHRTGLVMKPHTYKTNFGDPQLAATDQSTYSQLIYAVWNTRPGYGPYLKIFVGLFAAILIALLPLFIKPTDVDPRFGLGVGGFFGAVANTFIAASLVPDSGVLTLMDMVNGIGMVTIFLTLVQSTISLYLYDIRGRVRVSQVFDRVSLVIFGVGLVVTNILIPYVAMVR
jgi:hypothetical protein